MIPYGRQDVNALDAEAVARVLASEFLTQGPKVPEFEARVAEYCGAAHAVAVTNATSALHLACLASGLGPGDLAWTSPNSFVASANCIRYCGAEVDFVDIDPLTYNLDPEALREKLKEAEKRGRLPKAIIPVHFSGQPCDMERIAALTRPRGIALIEDASHAIGARWNGIPVGSCANSDMTVFSFHPVKIITTGEGGMILTSQKSLNRKLSRLRNHGITREAEEMIGGSEGPWYYQQIDLGFNYRMTEFQAALGCSQMGRLDQFLSRRLDLADRYDRLLSDLPVTLPYRHPKSKSSFHLYAIQLQSEVPDARRKVFETLRAEEIGANVHYIPIHTQPDYRRLGFRPGDFPNAEAYYHNAITLPLYPGLSHREQDKVVSVLREAIRNLKPERVAFPFRK